jgi:hypothetical protein
MSAQVSALQPNPPFATALPRDSSLAVNDSSQTSDSTLGDGIPPTTSTQSFKYYFILIALALLVFCTILLCHSSRKRRKRTRNHRHSQRALAQDVAGWRERFGRSAERVFGIRTEEGLNERGEAPPAYVKEIGSAPPRYEGQVLGREREVDSDIGDVIRPTPAALSLNESMV